MKIQEIVFTSALSQILPEEKGEEIILDFIRFYTSFVVAAVMYKDWK